MPQWNCKCRVCRARLGRRPAREAAHPVEPRGQRRRRALAAAQRLDRSAPADSATPALQPKGEGRQFADRRRAAHQHRRRSCGGPARLARAPAFCDLGHARDARNDRRQPHLRRRRPRHRSPPRRRARRAVRAAAGPESSSSSPSRERFRSGSRRARSRPTPSARARSASRVEAGGRRLVYAPGCARVTDDLHERIASAARALLRRHALQRRRDDRERPRRQDRAAAWATCRSPARAERSKGSPATPMCGASSSTSTIPTRS